MTIPEGWENPIIEYIDELDHITDVLVERALEGHIIRPPLSKIMRMLRETPLPKVKVVLIGHNPYPGPDQADGLAFSVKKGSEIPPPLSNIFKELREEFGKPSFAEEEGKGDLSCWASQGVLLLNSSLTIEPAGESHNFLWKGFIKRCIKECSKKGKIAFALWGREAQKFDKDIDKSKNQVLFAAHPSSHNGKFIGCGHFKEINQYLKSLDVSEIIW